MPTSGSGDTLPEVGSMAWAPRRRLGVAAGRPYSALGGAGSLQTGRPVARGRLPMDLSFLTIGNKYTRPELAQRWGYASHHAISRGVVTPQGEKVILLFVTRVKQEVLTQSQDHLSGGLLFWEGQEKHGTDDRILGAAKAGDELHLFYREVHHTPFEYKGKVLLLSAVRKTDAPSQFVFRLEHDQSALDDLERFRGEVEAIPDATEREEVRKARVGQGRFRRLLLERWGPGAPSPGWRCPPS
jgi:putative restriction endonuclease